MKKMIRSTVASLLCIAAGLAYGGVPPVNVTVSDAGGKAAFKGTTNAKGTFATSNLKPGNYTVQFNSTSAAVKGNHYTIVVSAGAKKVSAGSVPGEKFDRGGVALKVDVGAGLNITGQVAAEAAAAVSKSGKKMVYIPPQTGSHFPGHWVEEGSAEAVAAKNAGTISTQGVNNIQESGRSPGQ
jgi:hypothetical protein